MKLISLKVRGHNKYKLNPELHDFTYTPDKHYQMLLGSNGAGKSTTASLIYPYPETNSVLEDGGHVKQEYSHNGKIYDLSMEKDGKSTRYSFMEDGEELNRAGKVTVQQSLVITHLGITSSIQDILIDKTKFTDMSALQYKKWVTLLSSTDYDYILNIYALLKKKQSYVRNVLKHNNKKRSVEVEKSNDNDRESIQSELSEKRKHLNKLMDLKVSVDTTVSFTPIDLEGMLNSVDSVNSLIANSDISSIDVLEDTVERVTTDLSAARILKADLYNKIETATQDIGDYFEMEDIPDEDTLIKSKTSIMEDLTLYKDALPIEEADHKLNTLRGVKDILSRYLQQLSPNNDFYTVDKIEDTKKELHQLKHGVKKFSVAVTELDNKLKELIHLKDHSKIKCPECEHEWYQVYNESTHKLVEEDFNAKTKALDIIEADILKKEKYVEDGGEYISILNNIKKIRPETRILDDLIWFPISKERLVDTNPSAAEELIQSVYSDLDRAVAKDRLEVKLANVDKLLSIRNSLNSNTAELAKRTKNDLEKELSQKIELEEKLESRLAIYKNIVSRVEHASKLKDTLRESLMHNKQVLKDKLQIKMQEALSMDIRTYKDRVYDLEQLMTRLEVSDRIIDDLDTQIEQLNKESSVLKITLEELSPEYGLIGHSLSDFIGNLVSNMNHYLDQVWSHDMVLEVPKIVNNKLSWKFPIVIGTNPVPDIGEMSSGEKNMVNLSFKLILMSILNLGEYMLILDEFGTNLDTEHRNKAMRFVSETLREYDFSNIFVISHYSEAYKTFPPSDTDYNALHTSNIDLGGIELSKCLSKHMR